MGRNQAVKATPKGRKTFISCTVPHQVGSVYMISFSVLVARLNPTVENSPSTIEGPLQKIIKNS